jgi:hypothetical protein
MVTASQATTPCSKALDNLYSIMQSIEVSATMLLGCGVICPSLLDLWSHPQGKLGGGEGCIGIYGSITQTGMQRIFESMRHNCGLNHNSILVDIGAGLGR